MPPAKIPLRAAFVMTLILSLNLLLLISTASATTTTPLIKREFCVLDFHVDPALVSTDKGPLGNIGAVTEEARESAGLRSGPLQRATKILQKTGKKSSPEELAAKVTNYYAEALVGELLKLKISAKRCTTTSASSPSLLIQGDFLTVSEGNAVREATVGFGTGAPDIEIAGSLIDGATVPPTLLYQFGGKNHDRKLPGGAVTLNPIAIGVKYYFARGATDKDVKKLAAQMAQDIAAFLKNSEVQPPGQDTHK
jgi:Domain of unknown function (DUF4410)